MKRLAIPALCACLALPSIALAEQSGAQPLGALRLSAQLYKTGRAAGDPLLVIAAAKLRKSVTVTATDRAPLGGSTVEGAGAMGWQEMLDTATGLATGDEVMAGLIEDVRAETTKGVTDGPVYSVVRIKPGGTDEYASLPFTGGQYAEIYVEGQGTSDLNLYVHDEQDRLVCSDTDISDIAYCGWRPASTGGFKITVANKGDAANQYSLMTN